MEDWEEGLDVDDSDLPSLLIPSNPQPLQPPTTQISQQSSLQPCSQHPRPSQSQSINRPLTVDANSPQSQQEVSNPCPNACSSRIAGPAGAIQAAMHRQSLNLQNNSRDYLKRLEEGAEDEDFKLNAWTCAMDLLGSEGRFALQAHSLCSIKTSRNIDRVPLVVGIIKSCKSNGIGDLIVTLKDPSGTIGATIHRKVLTESEFGRDIFTGAVVILKQVVVFSPTRLARYLNITLSNVVNIISKEGSPTRQTVPAFSVRHAASDKRVNLGPGIAKESAVISPRAAVVDEAVRKDSSYDKRMMEERQPEVVTGSLHSNSNCSSKATFVKEPNHENCGDSRVKQLIPKVSNTLWTDEQLNELFADFEDNDNLFHASGI